MVSDWLIDVGPGAGDKGAHVIAEGTPDGLAAMDHSFTGKYLKALFEHAGEAKEGVKGWKRGKKSG